LHDHICVKSARKNDFGRYNKMLKSTFNLNVTLLSGGMKKLDEN